MQAFIYNKVKLQKEGGAVNCLWVQLDHKGFSTQEGCVNFQKDCHRFQLLSVTQTENVSTQTHVNNLRT